MPASLDADGRRVWRRLTRELVKLGLVARVDRDTMAAYCTVAGTVARCARELRSTPWVLPNGRPSPWVTIRDKALREMRLYAAEFGLSPAARARIELEPPPSHDPEPDAFEELLRRGRKHS